MRLKKKTNKSFTLIELLVVISIIGLLSSVVLVSVGTARDKARIASGLQFASNLDHSLMPVGVWHFDDQANPTKDASGNNNHCQIFGNTQWGTEDECVQGICSKLNGSTYLNCGNDNSLNITNAITIATWVKVSALGTNQYRGIISKKSPNVTNGCQVGYGLVSSWGSGQDVWFGLHTDESTIDCNNWVQGGATLSLDKWYHVAGTYESTTGKQKIYIDGRLKNTRGWTIGTKIKSSAGTLLEIGRNHNSAWVFNGLIDEVRIYDEALTSMQIQTIYAQTKDKYYAQK